MNNEIYDLEEVKNEFIRNVSGEYAKVFNRQQMDFAVYVLNDFCNNLSGNGLVLLRYTPQPQMQQMPMQQPRYVEPKPQPRYVQPQYSPPQYSQPFDGNPFEEEPPIDEYNDPRMRQMRTDNVDVQRNITEMNAQLQQQPQRMVHRQMPQAEYYEPPQQPIPRVPTRAPPTRAPPDQDVNLAGDKPKTFVDKIKEMRVGKKPEKINPEE
jgi:hypothetical protein